MPENIIINDIPQDGLVNPEDGTAVQARADDINDFYSDNDVAQRMAVVPIKRYTMFPLANSDELTAYNAKTDADKYVAYKEWLTTIDAYPPL